jgi:hypothetical protein
MSLEAKLSLAVNVLGWVFMLGMVYQQLRNLREAVVELKSLFPRVNDHDARLARIEQRCEDRGERLERIEDNLRDKGRKAVLFFIIGLGAAVMMGWDGDRRQMHAGSEASVMLGWGGTSLGKAEGPKCLE